MSLAVYVAAASAEVDRAAGNIYALSRYFGVRITHDWTVQVRAATRPDRELSFEERRAIAVADYNAVRDAELVWLLAPQHAKTTGAWWEIGAAHALGRRVVVSGAGAVACVFTSLADRLFEHDTDALGWIAAEAASRAASAP